MEDLALDHSFWGGRTVLVTGHTGFKGAWLSLWLERLGARVVGLSPGEPRPGGLYEVARVGDGVESIDGDVRDGACVERALREHRPTVVFHMAAQALVRESYRDPASTFAINVMGTVNVLEAARRGGVEALVNVTSDKCYENREWDRGYREEDPKGGHDPYSASKGCSELVAAAYRRSFFAAGPGLSSARAGNVIGGGDWAADRLVPDLVRGALAGRPVQIRNAHALRPWQHVLSPLSGYLLLAERLAKVGYEHEGWNFGPGEADVRSVGELLEGLRALWGEGLGWELDETEQPHEAGILRLDSSRARRYARMEPSLEPRGGAAQHGGVVPGVRGGRRRPPRAHSRPDKELRAGGPRLTAISSSWAREIPVARWDAPSPGGGRALWW